MDSSSQTSPSVRPSAYDPESMVERVARALCEHAGHNPDYLEPGNVIIHPTDNLDLWESAEGVHLDQLADDGTRPPDGIARNGDQCHFMWRQYIGRAQVAIAAMRKPTGAMNEAGYTAACRHDHGDMVPSHEITQATWGAMIDEALR